MKIIIISICKNFISVIILFCLGLLINCSQNDNSISYMKKNTNCFYNLDTIIGFDKDSIFEVKNNQIRSIIKNKFNVEKLYYLNPININNKNIEGFTVYGYSEYSQFIYLIIKNKVNNNIISYDLIANQTGDGGDFIDIHSTLYPNLTYSKVSEIGYYSFSCPFDTTFYDRIQIDSCIILRSGLIKQNVVKKEKNIIKILLNQDC